MKKYSRVLISSCIVMVYITLISCAKGSVDFDVDDYGAVGDSLKVNTKFIQKAIDDCHKKGGGVVVLSDGIYISGTILLKDNVTLKITENAKLVGSSNPLDYKSIDTFVDATGQERGNCLIGAVEATNISVIGKGIVDGNGKAFTYDQIVLKRTELGIPKENKSFGVNRPFLLRFVRSSNISLKEITLRQPAAWTCHFYQSHDINVHGVRIYSHSNHNNDGIDLDSSYNAVIKNCNIDTGDDAICFKTTSPLPTYNIKVSDCVLSSEWGAIKFGTESMGDFYDIELTDCTINNNRGGGIKILSVDGANIHDIAIKNITMDNVDMPIFMRLGERLRTYRDAEQQEVGSITNVSIKNVVATARDIETSRVKPPTGIFITGTPDHKIGKVVLENIKVTLPGGGLISELKEVGEYVKKYPEYSFFEALPSYGLFGRHIKDLELKQVEFDVKSKDERKAIILEDTDNNTQSKE